MGSLAGGRIEQGAGDYQAACDYQDSVGYSSPALPPAASSSMSASTIMATSSSNPILGSQPSSSRAFDASAHSRSTSAGRQNAASVTTWSCQSRPAARHA